MKAYREILKHSAVYGIGQLLARSASILLLPLYTSHLTPSDYGIIALLDITGTIFSIICSSGIASAVNRYSFDRSYKGPTHNLWTTGLLMLCVIVIPFLLLAELSRKSISMLTLGPEIAEGPNYYEIAILTVGINVIGQYGMTYLRVKKKSILFICVTVSILLIQIILNVWFIAYEQIGIYGFLYSGVISGLIRTAFLFALLFVGKPFKIETGMLSSLLAYGWPLIFSGLAQLAMHSIDRFFLKWYHYNLADIGIYSLAYTIVQGVTDLIFVPFGMIWNVAVFEIDLQAERQMVYKTIFKYFTLALFLILITLVLFRDVIVRLMTTPGYYEASNLIPMLCLAFLVFPLHTFFNVPSAIHKRTAITAQVSIIAAIVNILSNMAFIPLWGIYGAAFSTIITYGTFSFTSYIKNIKIENFHFSMGLIFALIIYGITIYMGTYLVVPPKSPLIIKTISGIMAFLFVVATIMVGPARSLLLGNSPLNNKIGEILAPFIRKTSHKF